MAKLSWDTIASRALKFSRRWLKARREKADEQLFVTEFLDVFGVDDPAITGDRQKELKQATGYFKYIDFYWKGFIAIEMKSRGEDLDDAYEQLRQYMLMLPEEEIPDLWMVCDFENFSVWRQSTNEIYRFKLTDFRDHVRRFPELANYDLGASHSEQLELNVRAAEKMAKLHDAMKDLGYDGHALEMYMVRLLFCLFADDTNIFPRDSFYQYVLASREDGSDLADRLERLFDVLDTPPEERAKRPRLSEELKQFRYINGHLFGETLRLADFDTKMRKTLLECIDFDWSGISPAIFGAMFQGVMDRSKRRELGAHYTSEENILKLVNPLFLDELKAEFESFKTNPPALLRFHEKLSKLKFLDPACGCGNFLIITYRELRKLELEVLKVRHTNPQMMLDIHGLLKVNVGQFYGIELEEFPGQIAQVGMWLMDHQMNQLAEKYFGQSYARLPLVQSATIVHGNALRIVWENVVPKAELSYILGNPPFLGYSNQSAEQKADILSVYLDRNGKPFKTAGKIDYVAAWYYKAAQHVAGTLIRVAFVSTNSITQGEQISAIWKPLFEMFDIHIDFGYRTFKWSNEARGKAAVHCVIVGFSAKGNGIKAIYDGDIKVVAKHINPYLVDAADIFVESRKTPLCDVPPMMTGNRPADGGHLIIKDKDLADFVRADPLSGKYIRRFMGSDEFINSKKRWCLWLVGVSASELRRMPEVMKRIAACKQDRENATDEGRRKLAATPALFRETNNPDSFIAIPEVSSERRRYIPLGFMSSDTIVSNKIKVIPNATLYHFGILTSNVHMAWVRAVCGRLKSDYDYSKDIVYNNYPWPDVTAEQKKAVAKLAQAVLDARAKDDSSSLADLYDPLSMPPVLLKAHRELDRMVMRLYGFSSREMTEAECVAELMERYQMLSAVTLKLCQGEE